VSFLRPEATAQLLRWREVMIGLVILPPGLYWALTGSGLMPYIGAVATILGAMLIIVGRQRGRFRLPGRGPGIVRVTEAQIAYLGPLTGGVVALEDLLELSLDGTASPAHWVLSQPGQPELCIPVTAEGAEALFDAFARLPGLKTEHMLAQMHELSGARVVIWRAGNNLPRLR
jgi:hypothetical protein